MALTVDVLKTFMHETILEVFPDGETVVDGETVKTNNTTLENAVKVAIQNYNNLTSKLPANAVVRFDSESYQLKLALIHVYNYILQDNATLHSLSLSSMSLSENQVFEHYLALRNAEQEEVNAMKKELLDEIKDKEEDAKYNGVMLYHRYGNRSSGRRLP